MKFLTPVEDCFITSRFGEYRNYAFAPRRKQLHEGIDYAPALKDVNKEFLIHAAREGVVFDKGFDAKGYGNFVVLKHGERFYTWYGHLKDATPLNIGTSVILDEVLGIMGQTGNATGKHLHFNVQDMNLGANNYVVLKVVDPFPLMVDKIDTLQIPISVYTVISKQLT